MLGEYDERYEHYRNERGSDRALITANDKGKERRSGERREISDPKSIILLQKGKLSRRVNSMGVNDLVSFLLPSALAIISIFDRCELGISEFRTSRKIL